MSRPTRHHFVPRAYLARFAHRNLVLVRQRDSKIFQSNPVNVAVECGFYDFADGSGRMYSRIEELLAGVDGGAIAAMQSVDRSGEPPGEDTDERLSLAVFLALQNTRTPEQRERILFPQRVAEYVGGRQLTKQLMAEFLERVHLGFPPSPKEASAAFDYVSIALGEPRAQTSRFAIEMMLRSVDQVAPLLATMNWTLEFDRKEQLITSDLPIVIWRAPSPRDKYEGVGVSNADELRFPLDPGKQLVLSRRRRTPTVRITPERARACNADTANACHRFIVGCPNRPTLIEAPHMAERRPVVRFNTGPLYERQPDGTTEYQGEVLHMWVPRR